VSPFDCWVADTVFAVSGVRPAVLSRCFDCELPPIHYLNVPPITRSEAMIIESESAAKHVVRELRPMHPAAFLHQPDGCQCTGNCNQGRACDCDPESPLRDPQTPIDWLLVFLWGAMIVCGGSFCAMVIVSGLRRWGQL
jgi:hypothetical protein